MPSSSLLPIIVFLGLFAIASGSARGEAQPVWRVENRLFGKADPDEPGGFKKSKNISGIACVEETGFPRVCLVIDDEQQGAQVVVLTDGRLIAGERIPLISDTFDGKKVELDGEGVAFADGAFYVVGSHGHPRDKKGRLDAKTDAPEIAARIRASSQIIRVPIDAKQIDSDGRLRSPLKPDAPLRRLRDAILADDVLKSCADRRLENNGVTIEGIAVRKGRLFVGFRGPLTGGPCAPPRSDTTQQALVLSLDLEALRNDRIAEPRRHGLALGPDRGVRDLARHEDGFLILAGPVADPDEREPVPPGAYAIFRWDGERETPELLLELPAFVDDSGSDEPKAIKPEALLPLDREGDTVRLLVLFDGAKEGGPRVLRIQ